MVEVNPTAPSPNNPTGPQGASNSPPASGTFDVGGGWGAYKEWLGPEGYKKFQEMLCQNISAQINHDREKEQETKEIMKKSIEGETDIYS